MKPEDFAKELDRIMNKLLKEATSKESLQDLGDEAAGLIKKRTRLGFGVDKHEGTKKKLDALDKNYIKYVRSKKATGPTSKSKSNLTLTGDMLDKLEATVGDSKVTIGFSDSHAEDKAKWNTDKGRPFNFLSKAEILQLKKRLQDKLYSRIKELLPK